MIAGIMVLLIVCLILAAYLKGCEDGHKSAWVEYGHERDSKQRAALRSDERLPTFDHRGTYTPEQLSDIAKYN